MLLFPQNYKVFRFPQNLKRIKQREFVECRRTWSDFAQGRRSVPAELTPRCSVRPSYRLLRPRSRENLYPAGTSHFPRPWAGHVRRNRPPARLTLSRLPDEPGNLCSPFRSTPFLTSRGCPAHSFEKKSPSKIFHQIFTNLFLTLAKKLNKLAGKPRRCFSAYSLNVR